MSATHKHVPIQTCLAAMENASTEQLEAIERLIQKPTVQRMFVGVDDFNEKNLLFGLYGNRGPDDCFLNGLITQDGGVNT